MQRRGEEGKAISTLAKSQDSEHNGTFYLFFFLIRIILCNSDHGSNA